MAWRLNRQSTQITAQMLRVDSRFRGNDDFGHGRPEYCHSREGGNPLAAFVRAFELWLLKDSNDNLEGFFPTAL